jgi:membrane protein required for beta-lactamase induction
MTVGSLVERIELADRTAMWIVANRRFLAPIFWMIATLTPLIVFWIGPLVLQGSAVRQARSAHLDWIESGQVPHGRVIAPREFLTGLR